MNNLLDTAIEKAKQLVDRARSITVLTGAGISTDSGLPDFRGPNGLWTKNPEAEKASNIANYVNEPSVREANWALRAEGKLWADVAPNNGHRALLELQRRGSLHTLITQNVDELHQMSGIDAERVVEIHGTTRKAGCLSCTYLTTMEVVLERVRAGEADPSCPRCGGIVKSATISFGQALIAADLTRSQQAADEADLLFAIGSTLTVNPIASIVPRAIRGGAALIIVNGEETPFDGLANAVVRGSISDVLPRIISAGV
ncbi:MAG: NAD-dependent deacetylase [Verrucomicrobiales bacterium]|jgi:NAD-dependent deacetylase